MAAAQASYADDVPSSSVLSVSCDERHRFTKPPVAEIVLIEGLGVQGDSHAGETVQHLHRLKKDAGAPNLRQVHLIQAELFDEVAAAGYTVRPGDLGENVTTRGIDLLALATGTVLRLGSTAAVRITGLRNPCLQINGFESGLMKQLIGRDADGDVVRRAGVMAVVLAGGVIRPGDPILVEPPAGEPVPLQPV